jgi:hypothetical protein
MLYLNNQILYGYPQHFPIRDVLLFNAAVKRLALMFVYFQS